MPSINVFRRLLGGQADRRQQPRLQAEAGACVMVVDDSSTIRAVLAKLLIQDGYAVLPAENGEQALELARSERPALIFLDIVLPGMNGFMVLRALRHDERTRDIPIVMISGNVQATEQFYVQRFGADDFMKKPFGRAEVFDRIRRLVESGRMVARQEDISPAALSSMSEEEMAAIPDVAMPDPGDLAGVDGDAAGDASRV
ncbi:response regulator [Oleiagrimonas soli]|uniref:Histidine kinase n=1 Tax=Oleiagrimonas soli TaxID=1543381 RepID=A0A099CWE8_9GAMM|nr:response regulator [Oleiagrimonas soli]KGI77976.1 histidine kinase [Oleiagrimonas soli]MBB6183645.1 twitching motility two-component system response regulator PilH [Oleiagrimonas soli]